MVSMGSFCAVLFPQPVPRLRVHTFWRGSANLEPKSYGKATKGAGGSRRGSAVDQVCRCCNSFFCRQARPKVEDKDGGTYTGEWLGVELCSSCVEFCRYQVEIVLA